MRRESALDLKRELLAELLPPLTAAARRTRMEPAMEDRLDAVSGGLNRRSMFAVSARPMWAVPTQQRSIALGIAPRRRGFRLAIRVQRQALLHSPLVAHLVERARGEADVRMIGRIDKRARRKGRTRVAPLRASPTRAARAWATDADLPWYQRKIRPLLIGASVGHVDISAGSVGAFVVRDGRTCLLSNNHVLANEGFASAGDSVVQPGTLDRGRDPADRVADFLTAVDLDPVGTNFVDAALAELVVDHDPSRLREITGSDQVLAGLGPEALDEQATVYKIGRTTGATEGVVTAFELDNVMVGYDIGNVRFDGQIEIEGVGDGAFSDGGDSGALIVDAEMQAVGLLFSGTDSGATNGSGLTYANPIHRVLDDLEATLLS